MKQEQREFHSRQELYYIMACYDFQVQYEQSVMGFLQDLTPTWHKARTHRQASREDKK